MEATAALAKLQEANTAAAKSPGDVTAEITAASDDVIDNNSQAGDSVIDVTTAACADVTEMIQEVT